MANIIKRIISTNLAPKPVGAYSQAVAVGNTMYLSGQIGLDPSSGVMVQGGVQAEAEQVMKNMQQVLIAAGADYRNVVKTTILLADINNFQVVNEVYSKFFTSDFPARAAYQVAALPKGALVEMEAVAVLDLESREA